MSYVSYREDSKINFFKLPAGMMGNSAEFKDYLLPVLSKIGGCQRPQTVLLSLQKPGKVCYTAWIKL